jgi:alkylated DNA repair protein (DNA oxidative demethylase)
MLWNDASHLAGVEDVLQQAPLRQMQTPGGHTMSVAMSNCGELGWVSDRHGYRYSRRPANGRPWPAMPQVLHELARSWAAKPALTTLPAMPV